MDYQKTESQNFDQAETSQPELPKPEDLRTKADLGELGRQAIFSENQDRADEQPNSLPLDETQISNDNISTPEIKIIEEVPSSNSQEITPSFQPSAIHKNGDKISRETLDVVKNIASEIASNPAQAVTDFQRARKLYNEEGKVA